MLGKWIGQNTIWKGILNSWRGIYCKVLPIIAVGVYIVCYRVWKVKIWESENFPATLESMVTFVSIIISFFGVLLTILISAKEKSELINYFLDSADKKAFSSSIKKLILHGLLTVIVAAILFMYDIIHFLRREMLDFTAFPVFFVSNLLLVQRKKYYFNRATVSRNCSIVL